MLEENDKGYTQARGAQEFFILHIRMDTNRDNHHVFPRRKVRTVPHTISKNERRAIPIYIGYEDTVHNGDAVCQEKLQSFLVLSFFFIKNR
jgi:hypothetical protein